MQAALQGMLDAVLRARRGPWLHPESSPARGTDTSQPGEPQAGGANGLRSRRQSRWALVAQLHQPCHSSTAQGIAWRRGASSHCGPTAQRCRQRGAGLLQGPCPPAPLDSDKCPHECPGGAGPQWAGGLMEKNQNHLGRGLFLCSPRPRGRARRRLPNLSFFLCKMGIPRRRP